MRMHGYRRHGGTGTFDWIAGTHSALALLSVGTSVPPAAVHKLVMSEEA